MSNWKKYRLGEIATRIGDGLHGTPKYDENGEYYFINGSNLIDGKIVINANTKKISEHEFLKHKKELSEKTILLGINGTIGNIALYQNEKCILGKSAAYINVRNEFDKNFIRYILANKHFQDFIKTNATGTTIKNVGLALLRDYEFFVPDLPTQTRIASILSTFDDKIELLGQMNQTLETMAQTIFKEWFVDFNFPGFDGELVEGLPKGWRMGSLYELIEVTYGFPFKSNLFNSEGKGKGLIRIRDLKNNFCGFFTEEVAQKKYLINAGDIVVGMDAEFIPSIWLGEQSWLNQRVCKFSSKEDAVSELFIYHTMMPLLERSQYGKVGTTVIHLGKSDIDCYEILIPSVEILHKFKTISQDIYKKIIVNQQQIRTLTHLCDALLPKLMSGQIEIKK